MASSSPDRLLRDALDLAMAGDGRAVEAMRSAVALVGGHRPAFEGLIALAGATPDGLADAERLMRDLALTTGDAAMRADLVALFSANARWELVLELGGTPPPDALKARAAAWLESDRPAGAARLLEAYARLRPQDPDASTWLGRLADEAAEPARAEALHRRAQALEATPGPATAALGEFLWHHGRDAEALPWLEAAHRARPADMRLAGLRASALFALGREADMAGVFADALAAGALSAPGWAEAATALQGEPSVFSALGAAVSAAGDGAAKEALAGLPPRRTFTIGLYYPRPAADLTGRLDDAARAADRVVVIGPPLGEADQAAVEAAGALAVEVQGPSPFGALKAALKRVSSDWFMQLGPSDRLPAGMARVFAWALQRPALEPGVRHYLTGRVVYVSEGSGLVERVYERVLIGPADPRATLYAVSARQVQVIDRADPPLENRVTRLGALALTHVLGDGAPPSDEAPADAGRTRHETAGALAARRGDTAAAAAAYRAALAELDAAGHGRTNKAHIIHIQLANQLLTGQSFAEALEAAHAGLRAFPNDPDLLGIQGVSLVLLGRAAEAIAPLRLAIAHDGPQATSVSFKPYATWLGEMLLGVALTLAGQPGPGAGHLARAWAACDTPAALWQRAELLSRALMGGTEWARRLFTDALGPSFRPPAP